MVVVSIVCVLGLLEWSSRALSPDEFYVWPPHFQHTFDPTPGLIQGVEFPSRLTINELGIRGRMPEDSEYNILAIGGSTTICAMLDDSKAWPRRLEENLNASLGPGTAWVGNVGRPGHTTTQHILQTEKLLAKHDFVDAIILLVGANDMMIVLAGTDPEVARQFLRPPPPEHEILAMAFALTPDSEEHLPWYSRNFVSRTARRLSWSPAKRSGGLAPMDSNGQFLRTVRGYRKNASTLRSELPDLKPALARYKRQLEEIIDIGSAAGVRVIFMSQPALWKADLNEAERDLLWMGGPPLNRLKDAATYFSVEALAEALNAYNDTLLRVCQSRNVDCVDAAAVVPRDPRFFYDDAHFTEKGAELIATTAASQLLSSGVLSRKSKP